MKKFLKQYVKYLIMPLFCVCCIVLSFFINFPVVYGQSMEKNFHEGDILLMNKQQYKAVTDIERFDVVVVKSPDGYFLIKRVIALPGETIHILCGRVFIDDVLLDDPYAAEDYIENAGIAGEAFTVPSDSIFVMGDNRNESGDSRMIGSIPFDKVRGKCERFLLNAKGNKDERRFGQEL